MDDRDVLDVVEGIALQQASFAQQALELFGAFLGEGHCALFLVELEIGFVDMLHEVVDRDVEVRLVVQRTGNDQRRARLIDQDRIDFVDDRIAVAALYHRGQFILHVVAQVVEAVFVVGAVGDVAGIGLRALVVVETVDDDADGHAEEAVDLAHPLGVALGQVVVDGDDMHALAFEGIEVDGKGRNQRLAFAGSHLGDLAVVQDHAADELDVEMPQAKRAPRCFAHRGEGGYQQIVERGAVGQLLAEFDGPGRQSLVAQRLQFGSSALIACTLGCSDLTSRSFEEPKTLRAMLVKMPMRPLC